MLRVSWDQLSMADAVSNPAILTVTPVGVLNSAWKRLGSCIPCSRQCGRPAHAAWMKEECWCPQTSCELQKASSSWGPQRMLLHGIYQAAECRSGSMPRRCCC